MMMIFFNKNIAFKIILDDDAAKISKIYGLNTEAVVAFERVNVFL